jgi:hypothetical protein
VTAQVLCRKEQGGVTLCRIGGFEMVVCRDNFFQETMADFLEKATELYKWRYGQKSFHEDYTKFFVCHLWDKWLEEQSQNNLYYKLWTIIQRQCMKNYECWRIVANGQVKGQNGSWHLDDEEHGAKTIVYFPLEWSPEWGGSLYFSNNKTESEVKYQKNRLVMFDSHMLHYGEGPAVDNIIRISIAFNLKLSTLGPKGSV